jgi:hypothetical protein
MKYVSAVTVCIFFLIGCTSRTVSNTPRTAIEQLLLSAAVDKALSKVQVPELAGKKAYLDFSNLRAYDAEYVESAVRACIAENGLIIIEKADDADYTVRVSSGGLGNEYKEFLLGIPALPVPGSPMTLPEVALFKAVEQDGIVKLFVVFYADGKLVSANHYYGKAERDETFLLWMRFQPKDDIRKAWEKADAVIEKETN